MKILPQRMFFYPSVFLSRERNTLTQILEREKRVWQCTSFAWGRCSFSLSFFFTFSAHTFSWCFLLCSLSHLLCARTILLPVYHHLSLSLSLKRSALFSISSPLLCSSFFAFFFFFLRWGLLIYWHWFTSTPSLDFASWKAYFISLFRCLSFLLSLSPSFLAAFFLFIILIFLQ